jgi:RNA polymerase sigma factor (sigma-70 family)
MTAVALAPASVPRLPRRKECSRADARETERRLLARYHREGDLAAREELVERFLPLARDLALRYTYTDEPFDDLLQVASLGLIKAIDRFEPDRGTKFTSYAAPTILGELKRHFRDKGWALHVPRDLQERTLAVSRETEALSKTLGRSPKWFRRLPLMARRRSWCLRAKHQTGWSSSALTAFLSVICACMC